jgi:hypothetical protein
MSKISILPGGDDDPCELDGDTDEVQQAETGVFAAEPASARSARACLAAAMLPFTARGAGSSATRVPAATSASALPAPQASSSGSSSGSGSGSGSGASSGASPADVAGRKERRAPDPVANTEPAFLMLHHEHHVVWTDLPFALLMTAMEGKADEIEACKQALMHQDGNEDKADMDLRWSAVRAVILPHFAQHRAGASGGGSASGSGAGRKAK